MHMFSHANDRASKLHVVVRYDWPSWSFEQVQLVNNSKYLDLLERVFSSHI
jgi:hypothetical protein